MNKKSMSLIAILFSVTACIAQQEVVIPSFSAVVQNTFQDVWTQITSDPLESLPHDKVSLSKLSHKGKNIILGRSRRTLKDHADITEPFDKLAHPNGVCLKGLWEIYGDNKYSGYFQKGSQALIIVRASTAMSKTRSGDIRAFGFAGKLFPTTNPQQLNKINTANFFLIDDLGGTRAKHYTDVSLTNEPSVSKNSEVLKNLFYAIKVARTFAKADKNPGMRQVYEISELGENDISTAITPQWMKVTAKSGQTIEEVDFRDELRVGASKGLVFDIAVASQSTNGKKDWQTIGTITLDEAVVSTTCDHRLHFHHPEWRSNLKH